MQGCNRNHSRSSQITTSGGQSALPTRVLDIYDDVIRLYVSRGGHSKYAALSHCWGLNPPLRTLKSNFDSHLEGIGMETLPKTFQQAVQVERELSLRYIWIDSLCIIQGDSSDWEREAVIMGGVYEGVEVTISATGSTKAHDGCFITRVRMPDAVPLRINYKGRAIRIHAALRPESALTDLQKNPLAHRAWITQE
ncbi:heterokaryon incompatibility protein-domain-containing protein [Clohesyomyces aquaticus]|uniref:Heterokaryon incompatibility protein-domain-containing protein n=1 Tax=Clohesyomyces aquaticus TaxID=1231657 RepID=A0A1Y1ZA70_9PLEO|nr:heterokaryon incompatibility protein-domain-containing protein [Clohesyomyces aquaticus]